MALQKTTIMSKNLRSDAAMARYLAVISGSDEDHCALPGAAKVFAVGITQAATTAAEEDVEVMMQGISPATAAAAIAVDDPVCIDGVTGKLRKALLLNAGANIVKVVGYATTAAAANNDVFYVLLAPAVGVEA